MITVFLAYAQMYSEPFHSSNMDVWQGSEYASDVSTDFELIFHVPFRMIK